ncbi:MAG TPA: hypothetical protein VK302_10440, partial [Terriglobales bacterium]|nr:hypothetical protein [Terriglobales bacterium]
YPLYSGADEALYLLGQSYEGEINAVRKNPRANEVVKTRMIEELTKGAAEAYGKIIKRYPAMDRAVDAKARLEVLHQPVPRPTRAALEQSKKEEASRQQAGMLSKGLGTFEKFPDVSRAARVGEPTMVDPEPVTATGVVRELTSSMGGGDSKLKVETVNGTVTPNQEAPRSPAPAVAAAAAPAPVAAAELKPTVPDPNELKPNVEPDQNTLPPLQQSNQMDSSGATSTASSSTTTKTEEMADISSSKKKKKRGLKKLNPF